MEVHRLQYYGNSGRNKVSQLQFVVLFLKVPSSIQGNFSNDHVDGEGNSERFQCSIELNRGSCKWSFEDSITTCGISGLFRAIDSHEFLMLHYLLNGEENGQQKNPDKNRDIRLKVVFLFLGFVQNPLIHVLDVRAHNSVKFCEKQRKIHYS